MEGRRQWGRGPADAACHGLGPDPPRPPPAPLDQPSWRLQGSIRQIGRSLEPGSDWSGTLGHSTETERERKFHSTGHNIYQELPCFYLGLFKGKRGGQSDAPIMPSAYRTNMWGKVLAVIDFFGSVNCSMINQRIQMD